MPAACIDRHFAALFRPDGPSGCGALRASRVTYQPDNVTGRRLRVHSYSGRTHLIWERVRNVAQIAEAISLVPGCVLSPASLWAMMPMGEVLLPRCMLHRSESRIGWSAGVTDS